MQAFLALHGSLKTGSRLRDSDCPLTSTVVTGSCLNPASHKWDVAKGISTFMDPHLILCSQLAHGYLGRRVAPSVIEAFRSGFVITSVFLPHHSVQSYLLPLRVTRTPLGGPVRGVSVSWRSAVDRRWPLGNTDSANSVTYVSKLCLETKTSWDTGLCNC